MHVRYWPLADLTLARLVACNCAAKSVLRICFMRTSSALEHDRLPIEFRNIAGGGFASNYEWVIRDAQGAVVPAPAGSANQPLSLASLPDGIYNVQVKAFDSDAKITQPYTSGSVRVTVDKTPPTLTVVASQNGAAQSVIDLL